MPFVVKLAEAVDGELLEISDFIALDNPSRADTFIRDLVEHFQKVLSEFPESGRLVKNGIRQISHKKYTAFIHSRRVSKPYTFFTL
ncbi:MAG: type II toxin-antitoxin system RelE/ParE family toxin [Gammaproteobacteria bacterium]|nr:type II toxin-antitoxin system RelE/ParE family toxin [Gammaproteobacteria bacterium]NKB65147.1 type II toxin-antitoxin system RelE/ParE family toxin [Gammaproteobacteria bacterium]